MSIETIETVGRPRVAVVLGTRPEVIKLFPVVRRLRASGRCVTLTVGTGQQREMQRQAAATVGLRLDHDLEVMRADQSLPDLTARLISTLTPVLVRERPELVLVQGDTTTALAAALCAYYQRIPVGHVEAGLRTGDKLAPFPEEGNRRLIAGLADLHFAPTERARANLLAENLPHANVFTTGNTIVDALRWILTRMDEGRIAVADPVRDLEVGLEGRRLVLVTGHRRENFGPGMESICRALRRIAEQVRDVAVVYPVHLNPRVRQPVRSILEGCAGIHLLPPLDHPSFLSLLRRAAVVLTDSGGIQEEATALGKPTLILRLTTERPEAVESGVAELVGTDAATIEARTLALLRDEDLYRARCAASAVFGDGRAAQRIADHCLHFLRDTRAVAIRAGEAT